MDKHGKKHPGSQYVAGRIASKNRQEFIGGKWTARLKVHDNGQKGMFPAWWLLGALNNEPPVEEPDETVCWPLVGSGEVDIFEHYGSNGADHYAVRVIKSQGECDKGDWFNPQKVIDAKLGDWHEYSAEWRDGDIVFLMDGKEVHRNVGFAKDLPEPFFAILNFAKITDDPMEGEWIMEVDWVKHESRVK
jgi:beta-glucanase (GH16 family)